MSLGSGLDAVKLADTIGQIGLSDSGTPVLICHSPHNDHAWIHLAAAANTDAGATAIRSWSLTCGTGDQELAEKLRLAVAKHVSTARYDVPASGLFAVVILPGDTQVDRIADLIIRIMFDVQHVQSADEVELSLEFR